MKKKVHQGTGLYAHLSSMGVLSSGNDETIRKAKKEYWKHYRKEWKKNKRQQSKVYILMFSFKEARVINQKARPLCITPSQYIKQSALTTKGALGSVLLGKVREQLILSSLKLEEMADKNIVTENLKNEFLEAVNQMEESILSILSEK